MSSLPFQSQLVVRAAQTLKDRHEFAHSSVCGDISRLDLGGWIAVPTLTGIVFGVINSQAFVANRRRAMYA